MKTQHTPGPWTAKQDTANGLDRYLLHSPNGNFGHFQGWAEDGVTTEDEDKANVQLIAASPRMLAALKELRAGIIDCPALDSCRDWDAMLERAAAAIADAEDTP